MLQEIIDAIGLVLFPPLARCSLCSAPLLDDLQKEYDDGVCDLCIAQLPWIKEPFCPRCHLPDVDSVKDCPDCQGLPHGFRLNRSLLRYEDSGRELMHLYKFRNRIHLARFFAAEIAKKIICILPETYDIISYVPMHPQAVRQRGYNQSEILAKELSLRCDIPCRELLRKLSISVPSSQLTRDERWLPERGEPYVLHQKAREHLSSSPKVILVDDVLTTGATAHFCSMLLREAGAKEIAVLTVAR